MDEIFVWNALTGLKSELAYHFWVDFYYTDPDTRRQLSTEQKLEKLSVAKTKFYAQRNEIFKELNLSGIQDVTDIYIRVIQEMVGSDDPTLLYGPPRLRDWPPAKKELPTDLDPQITAFIGDSRVTSESEEEDESQGEENGDVEQDEEYGNGANGDDENGGGLLQRLPEDRRLLLIFGILGSIALIIGGVFLARAVAGRVGCEVREIFGNECPTPTPTATHTPTPGPTPNETGTAAAVQAVIAEGLTRTREAQSTPDSGATAAAGIVATQSQEASLFTATPSPIPTNTPLPTDTPTITPTPTPSFPLPFTDDFSDGLDPQWNTTEGTVAISDGWLNGAGDRVTLIIGDDSLSRYVVEFDFSIPRNFFNYLIWGDEITYRFHNLAAWWMTDSGTIKQTKGVDNSGTLRVIVDGNHYQVFLNELPFDDVIYGEPYSGPLLISLYYATSISNFSIHPLDQ